jgi:hypothetical protein
MSLVGGTLVLTDDALVFKPLAHLGRRKEIALADIENVGSDGDKPPRLRVSVAGRKPLVFLTLPKRGTPVWSADASARDDAIEAIRAAIAQGS